jgi:hypothetical protein
VAAEVTPEVEEGEVVAAAEVTLAAAEGVVAATSRPAAIEVTLEEEGVEAMVVHQDVASQHRCPFEEAEEEVVVEACQAQAPEAFTSKMCPHPSLMP